MREQLQPTSQGFSGFHGMILLAIVSVVCVSSVLGGLVLLAYRGKSGPFAGPASQTPTGSSISAPITPITPGAPVPPLATSTQVPGAALPPGAEWRPWPPLPSEQRGLITQGNRGVNTVALTFDACQAAGDLAGYDTEIIRVLREMQTPATLFLGGLWMRDHMTQTLALAGDPLFEIGNHSWSHLDFAEITPDQMQGEILLTQQFMWEKLGWQTKLFRFPFGTYSQAALDVVAEQGLYAIQWDVVSGDPDPNVLAEPMADWVLAQVQPGSIIIMHVNGRGWHTAEALPTIIDAIRGRGYTFVTISELLGIE